MNYETEEKLLLFLKTLSTDLTRLEAKVANLEKEIIKFNKKT